MKTRYLTLLVVSMALAATSLAAQARSLPDADDIVKQVNARNEGEAVSRRLRMELTDRRGKQRVRETKGYRKYYGKEKRSVIYYLSPKNIKDTAFLTYDYPQAKQDDDQWLYLPALRKVRRISASDRGDYFLGTDFTYEDIKLETKLSIEDYRRKTLAVDQVDDHQCYVVEAVPVTKKVARELGYGRVEQCIDPEIWMVRRAKIWDVRGKLLKTIYNRDIRKVQDIWTTHRIEAENHKSRHKTVFVFTDVDYNSAVVDKRFTQQAMRHGL